MNEAEYLMRTMVSIVGNHAEWAVSLTCVENQRMKCRDCVLRKLMPQMLEYIRNEVIEKTLNTGKPPSDKAMADMVIWMRTKAHDQLHNLDCDSCSGPIYNLNMMEALLEDPPSDSIN